MKWQAVFFDFDGVILDSVDVKTQAFAAMFRKYGAEVEKAVVEYHLVNGGISRFKKFEHYYKHILGKNITDQILETLGLEFNQLSMEGVLAAPFIDGALETLKQLKEDGIPAFVVSGTPDDEIKVIVEKRKLSPYFKEVHGSPMKKYDIISGIAKCYDLSFPDCLFIGDAMTDFEAATACGTRFLGIVDDEKNSQFPEGTFTTTTTSSVCVTHQ